MSLSPIIHTFLSLIRWILSVVCLTCSSFFVNCMYPEGQINTQVWGSHGHCIWVYLHLWNNSSVGDIYWQLMCQLSPCICRHMKVWHTQRCSQLRTLSLGELEHYCGVHGDVSFFQNYLSHQIGHLRSLYIEWLHVTPWSLQQKKHSFFWKLPWALGWWQLDVL